MQVANENDNPQSVIARCRVVLQELAEERQALVRAQHMSEVATSKQYSQHTAVMRKAIDKVIVDVAVYIQQHASEAEEQG